MTTSESTAPTTMEPGAPDGVHVLPVTVVIPAHNRERLLRRALSSVLVQRPRAAEILVVDDASSDGTAAVAEGMGARVVRHERNLGEGPARNSGLAAATQPWVALLDSDDEWVPGHLDALWRGRGGHVLVATSSLRCSDDPRRDRFHGAARGRPLVLRSPRDLVFPEDPVPVSAVMVQRDVALAAGGYRALRHCADFDFELRCLELGTGTVLPQVGMIYHLHDGQVSLEDEAMKDAHTRIACSYSDRPWFDQRQITRWRAAVAWDTFRREGGIARGLACIRPSYLPALVRLWSWRFWLRRRGAQLSREVRALAMENAGAG
jgi:glycosyltransferase involved in cell wall biosynthesis